MLSVYLFGGLTVDWRDNALSAIPGKVARSLFAYLLAHRDRAHTRDLLIGTFWPELAEDVARRRLSQALWQIRNSLAVVREQDVPPIIVAESDTLCINPDIPLWVDVDDFTQHLAQASKGGPAAQAHDEAALALYKGEFMEGYYEDWVIARREQLRLLLLKSLARLVESYKSLGDYEHALTYARCLVEEEPWHEVGQREIMRLCHLLDRDAEALKQFEHYQQLLMDEMQATPSPETVALIQEISRHDDFDGVVDLPISQPALPALIFDNQPAPQLPLIGRDTERAALLTHIEAMFQGFGGLILLEGEAGIGKTRLVQTLAQDAEWRGGTVLWGTSHEVKRAAPYAQFTEALGTHLTTLRAEQLTQLVAPIWLRVLKPLIPPLRERLPNLAPPPQLDPAQEKNRLVSAFAHLLMGWSQITPLLFILEDLQWAGVDMLALLGRLLPMLKQHPILLVGSYRSSEARANPGVWEQIQALDRIGVLARLRLTGLDVAATGELIRRGLSLNKTAPLFETRLYQETQGNPLFVLETLRTLHSEGLLTQDKGGTWATPWDDTTCDYAELPLPQAVEQTITRRLERLPPSQRRIMHLAAVLGEHIDFKVLSTSSETASQALLATLRALVRYHFLDEREKDYGFRHDKVRQVAYDNIDAALRPQLHHRVAQVLEQLHPDQIHMLAHHWTRANVWKKAAAYHQRAGEQAQALYANAEAIDHYTQALAAIEQMPDALEQKCAVLLAREAVHDFMGARDAQAKDLHALSTLVLKSKIPLTQIKLCLQQANYHYTTSNYPQALAAVQKAARFAKQMQNSQLQAESYRQWGRILWHQGKFEAARRQLNVARQLAQRHRLRQIEAQCLCDLGAISGQQGDHDQAQGYFSRSLTICRELGKQADEGLILNNLGIVARIQGNYDQARTYHEQSLHIRREVGHRRGESSVLNSLGIICRHQGDYVAAKHYFEQALAIMHSIGERWFACRTLYNLGICLVNLGDYANAKEHFKHSLSLSLEIEDRSSEAMSLEGLGTIDYVQNDHHAAHEKIINALHIVQDVGEPAPRAYILNSLGNVLQALGQSQKAVKIYQQAIDLRHHLEQPHQTIDPLAGLASTHLQQGNTHFARNYVEKILPHLKSNPLASTEQPFKVYWICYQVLHANTDSRARTILTTAYELLQKRAAQITDSTLQCTFLENVAEHQKIIAAYQNLKASQPEKHSTVALPCANAPLGRPLHDDEYVTVTWTLATSKDTAIENKVARRRHRLLRLLREAQAQGAIPRDADLAQALHVSLSTVRRDIAALRAEGHQLPPRHRKHKHQP